MSSPVRRGITALAVGIALLALSSSPGRAGVTMLDEFSGMLREMADESAVSDISRDLLAEQDPEVARAVATAFEERFAALRQAESALTAVAMMPTGTANELEKAVVAAIALQEQVSDTILVVMGDIALDIISPGIRIQLLSALESRTAALEKSATELSLTLDGLRKSANCDHAGRS